MVNKITAQLDASTSVFFSTACKFKFSEVIHKLMLVRWEDNLHFQALPAGCKHCNKLPRRSHKLWSEAGEFAKFLSGIFPEGFFSDLSQGRAVSLTLDSTLLEEVESVHCLLSYCWNTMEEWHRIANKCQTTLTTIILGRCWIGVSPSQTKYKAVLRKVLSAFYCELKVLASSSHECKEFQVVLSCLGKLICCKSLAQNRQ